MDVVLWIIQVLLAVVIAIHGWAMLYPQKAQLEWMPFIGAIPPALRRLIGVVELLAAAGLILPQLTHILAWLTPLAAAGLVILMLLAMLFHIPRKEYPNIVFNLVLLILSAFVAYGRLAM